MTYTVAVVGTGADPDNPDTDGYAMAYRHAAAYRRLPECDLIACCDIVPENATAFAERWDIHPDNVFEDAESMVQTVDPDIVSVCVPPHVHAEVVLTCAEHPSVHAIHCEKPMATTWGDCREMAEACASNGIQLTFNHQRRFGRPFRKAKSLLDDGSIGDLERIELGSPNLFDYGTHLFDLAGFYTDQATPEWVIAGIEYSDENIQFGAHNENQAIAQWRYDNGVYGMASTGEDRMVGPQIRLLGTEGIIEVGGEDPLRMRANGTWKRVDTDGETIHGPGGSLVDGAKQKLFAKLPLLSADTVGPSSFIERGIADLVAALEDGREPELSVTNALPATELIFGCWESARRRGRVEFPLEIEDNPLESMIEQGDILVADGG